MFYYVFILDLLFISINQLTVYNMFFMFFALSYNNEINVFHNILELVLHLSQKNKGKKN